MIEQASAIMDRMVRVTPSTLIHRETRALALLIVIAVGAFGVTRTVAHANQARRRRDAQAWAARGQASLQRHDAAAAAQQLRRASTLEPDNLEIRLALAAALASAQAIDEART